MKKLLLLALAGTLTISCSRDDKSTSGTTEAPVLVTKVIDGADILNISYSQGGKIKEVVNNSKTFKAVFTYNGDNISTIDIYDDGGLYVKKSYVYTNGKLVAEKTVNIDGSYSEEITYNHVSDNLIKSTASSIRTYITNGKTTSTIINNNNDYYLSGGNIYKIDLKKQVSSSDSPSYTGTGTTSIEFDTKNSPYKNITGINKLIDFNDFLSPNANNITKYDSKITYSNNGTSSANYTSTLTYNANNYPTKIVTKHTNFDNEGVIYYEYNK